MTKKYEYAIMTTSQMPDIAGERYVQISEHTYVNQVSAEVALNNWPSNREKFICQREVGEWVKVGR